MSAIDKAAASAARHVPHNPRELCRDFTPKPEPSEFWCANCGWNQPMHDDETQRTAIANELRFLVANTDSDGCPGFVPEYFAPSLCARCGDARRWHNTERGDRR